MTLQEFIPPRRLLLGPGPSLVHPRVLRALSTPLLGHLDPVFLTVMNDIQSSLRMIFETEHRFTIALSGTGSAGMEASIVNLVEPGDAVIVGINGIFGTRLASVVDRCGGKAIRVEAPWGECIQPDAVEHALVRSGPVKAVAIVHAETSTGAWQPLEDIGALCRRHDALFVVDAVTSLGGLAVGVDRLGIDVCYSGTQKCLSCPPGLSPLTMSERALAAVKARRLPCQSWYLDMGLIAEYWTEVITEVRRVVTPSGYGCTSRSQARSAAAISPASTVARTSTRCRMDSSRVCAKASAPRPASMTRESGTRRSTSGSARRNSPATCSP